MIELLLNNICIELGATHDMFFKVVKAGLKNPNHKKYFEQILATLNFMSFKKLMVKRNKELELEAMQMLQNEGHVHADEVSRVAADSAQAEIEHIMALSLAAEAERKRLEEEEEELIRKIMRESEEEYKRQQESEKAQALSLAQEFKRKEDEKLAKMKQDEKERYEKQRRDEQLRKQQEEEEFKQKEQALLRDKQREEETRRKLEKEQKKLEEEKKHLPPVTLKKTANVDLSEFQKLDVSGEIKESAELDEINKKIASKYSEKKPDAAPVGESLEERTQRLKKQRELLLKKKQEERAVEMQNYLKNGGTDLSAKKDLGNLPPIVSAEEMERRKNVVNKLRNSELN
jgi:hypothetical protein